MSNLIRHLLPLAAAMLIGCAAAPPGHSPRHFARGGGLRDRGWTPLVKSAPEQPEETTPHDGEFIEYRYLPELGKITICDQAVRGDKSVEYLESHIKQLAKRGIFPCIGDELTFYRRGEKAAEHKVETVIVIEPPTGKGENGDAGAQHVLVRIDGRIKVACTIGTSIDGEMWVGQVSIFPEDGTLEIVAVSADGQELSLPEEWLSFDSKVVITDETFFEDPPEEENPMIRV